MVSVFEPTWDLARELVDTLKEDLPTSLGGTSVGWIIPTYDGIASVHNSAGHAADGAKAFSLVKKLDHAWIQRELSEMEKDGIRIGNTFYRINEPGTWKIINPIGLAAWIEQMAAIHDDGHTNLAWLSLFPESSFRITGLRGLAERWGYDKAHLDAFVAYVPKDSEHRKILQSTPINKAPKFAQRLDDGEAWNDKRKDPKLG